MASPMVVHIEHARKKVWPEVQRLIDQSTHRIADLAGVEEAAFSYLEEYVATGNNARNRRRVICSETIWALARMGLLRTGQEGDVIAAAKAWASSWEEGDLNDALPEDLALVKAVSSLTDHDFGSEES